MEGEDYQPAIRGRTRRVQDSACRRDHGRCRIPVECGARGRQRVGVAAQGAVSAGAGMKSAFRRQSWILAVPVIVLLLWTVVYPNVAVIAGSFEDGRGHWREFANSPADREALWTSIVISVASVFASLAVGVPLAFLLGRFEFPGRRLLRAVATLPAALPPLVGVIAFLFLYGESGLITRIVQRVLGMSEAPWRLKGVSAIVFVHAYTM